MSYAKRHQFSAKEQSFLRRTSDRYNRIERRDAFNKRFGLDLTAGQIDYFCKSNGINSRHTFTDEEKEFLTSEWSEFGRVDLITEKFNNTFKKKRTYSSINHFYDEHGFKKRVKYTEEQDRWLHENINSIRYQDLPDVFNSTFGTNKTYASLNTHCHDIGVVQTDVDRLLFESRKERALTHRPVGHERKIKNITYIKYRESEYEDRFKEGSKFGKTYRDKRRVMYEMYHPDEKLTYDDAVIQIDGDLDNFGEDNLLKVPKIVSSYFTKMLKQHPNNTPEMNRTWVDIFMLDNRIKMEEKYGNEDLEGVR